MTRLPDSPTSFPPVKSRDTLNNDTAREKLDLEQGKLQVYGASETVTTLDDTHHDKEEAAVAPLRLPRARKPWYLHFQISKKSRIRTLFTPTHEIGPRPSYLESFKAALLYSYLNILLLFIPVSWALHYTHQSATLVFVFSCLAIIPLAALLGLGTEQIALRTSQSVGGLLNATLGNVVEMIIGGIALKQVCHIDVIVAVFRLITTPVRIRARSEFPSWRPVEQLTLGSGMCFCW